MLDPLLDDLQMNLLLQSTRIPSKRRKTYVLSVGDTGVSYSQPYQGLAFYDGFQEQLDPSERPIGSISKVKVFTATAR